MLTNKNHQLYTVEFKFIRIESKSFKFDQLNQVKPLRSVASGYCLAFTLCQANKQLLLKLKKSRFD